LLLKSCHIDTCYVNIFRLKSDLKQKESDLLGAKRDLKELQNKFNQHQQLEADLNRKTSKTLSMLYNYFVFTLRLSVDVSDYYFCQSILDYKPMESGGDNVLALSIRPFALPKDRGQITVNRTKKTRVHSVTIE
jgi:hypothetical protein